MRFTQILSKNAEILTKLSLHEFNQQLFKGTLPSWQFKYFLEQDELYLRDYSKALWLVSQRLPKKEHAQQFEQFSIEINETERQLHRKYLAQFPSLRFFGGRARVPFKIPVIANYTNYLLNSAEKAPLDEAVVSLSACYCIYKDMGERIDLAQSSLYLTPNSYLKWLASYSGKEFVQSTESIINIADELIAEVSENGHIARINLAFQRSAEYELSFFDESLIIGKETVPEQRTLFKSI